jgi:hypothetical protein
MARHVSVQINLQAWEADTARMPRLIKAVYFDVCFHNWNHVEPMPVSEQSMVFADLWDQGDQAAGIIDVLVNAGKLIRGEDGSLYDERALEAGRTAARLYEIKSQGGKRGAEATNSKRAPKAKVAANPASTDAESAEKIAQDSRKTADVTDAVTPGDTLPPGFLDKEKSPKPPKEIKPSSPITLSPLRGLCRRAPTTR